jgi:erythritol transport system ATP-binding protein
MTPSAAAVLMPTTRYSVALRAENVSKVFPGTVALNKVSFDVRSGAVNVLVGENGAGKSTLMKILAGVEQPTSGRLLLDECPVKFHSVRDAARQGIGIIFQELNLCPNLSATENIFIGHPIVRWGMDIDRRRQTERAVQLFNRLEQEIDPDIPVSDLRIGQQQIVEIAKALADDVRILIMDEPTSALSSVEIEILFRVVAELKAAGVAIIYISHRLDEIIRIGDYVTVLRDGNVQAEAAIADVTIPWLIAQMVGPTESTPPRSNSFADASPGLEIENICLPNTRGGFAVDHLSLNVSRGEIVGIYGLMGAGRSELFECLMGLQAEATGSICVAGRDVEGESTATRIRHGLALVPEDRQRAGLVQTLSVAENVTLASLWKFARYFSIDRGRERSEVNRMVRELSIKIASPETNVTALSGGNQQKVVIGKGLLTGPKVLLMDEPTRGIDVGAKAEVFRLMRLHADQGLAVIFATSDLKEVMTAADRVVVMANGRVTGDFLIESATEEAIVRASHPIAVRPVQESHP